MEVKNKDISFLNTQLSNAASAGKDKDIVYLLLKGAEINSRPILGATPIFVAVAYNQTKSVKLLAKIGADIETPNINGVTPLFKSAHSCHSDITKALLEAGANIESLSNGNSPLYAAISSGCIQDVRILLEAGALLYSDDITNTPILIATQERDSDAEHKEIYEMVMDHYYQELPNLLTRLDQANFLGRFRVVVVRYNEDLLWLNKEFKNEKIVIYNKGKDDLNLNDLPAHAVVINIPNVGWFGGTILYHLANYYDHLDDKTLFLQGNPYDQHLFLPLMRYKGEVASECSNMVAKCVETTLLAKSNHLDGITEEDWAETKYGGKFQLFDNYTMIDFTRQYVNQDVVSEDPLFMVWGAQFSVYKEKVYLRSKGFYQKILMLFDKQYPMEDFFLEKLWDLIFQERSTSELNSKLYYAAVGGDNQGILQALNNGADINSRHTIDATPLFAAVATNNLESVKLLVSMGANLDLPTETGENPLHRAAHYCRTDIVKFLLDSGADKEFVTPKKQSSLYFAVSDGCVDSVRVLLDAGASLYRDDTTETSLRLAKFKENESPEYKEIFNLIMDSYWKELEGTLPLLNVSLMLSNPRSFQVVVVRYDEDLSWLNKEFEDEEIIIYNKGKSDLDLENLPINSKIINIPNVGWFGGTILHHLSHYYDNLFDRTLFLQGEPYEQPLITPLIKYKGNDRLNCDNIIAKCWKTSLLVESDEFKDRSPEAWEKTKYGGKFKLFDNYTMIDFARQYIDKDISSEAPLNIILGAEFAVDKESVYLHEKEFYQEMLPIFNEACPMADFYLEKLWDRIFTPKEIEGALAEHLFLAGLSGEIQ